MGGDAAKQIGRISPATQGQGQQSQTVEQGQGQPRAKGQQLSDISSRTEIEKQKQVGTKSTKIEKQVEIFDTDIHKLNIEIGSIDRFCRGKIQDIRRMNQVIDDKPMPGAQAIAHGTPGAYQNDIINKVIDSLTEGFINELTKLFNEKKSTKQTEAQTLAEYVKDQQNGNPPIENVPVQLIAQHMLPEKSAGSIEQQNLRNTLNQILDIVKPGYCIDPTGNEIVETLGKVCLSYIHTIQDLPPQQITYNNASIEMPSAESIALGFPSQEQNKILNGITKKLNKELQKSKEHQRIEFVSVNEICTHMLPKKVPGSQEQQALRTTLNQILDIVRPGYYISPTGNEIIPKPKS